MVEIINWQDEEEKGRFGRPNLVAYCLIEAMSKKANMNVEEVFSPFNPKELEVSFSVNGVELSFKHCTELIQDAILTLEKEIKQSLKDEMIEEIYQDMQRKKDWGF